MGTVGADSPGFIQLILLFVFIVVGIFYCLSQQQALAAVQRQNRRIAPGLVWLQFIPLLGQIWQILVIIFIANSFRAEIESHREDSLFGIDAEAIATLGQRPTLGLGILFFSAWLLLVCFNLFSDPDPHGSEASEMGLIALTLALLSTAFFILYWVKLVRTTKRIVRLLMK